MKIIGNSKAISKISKRTWARANALAKLANIAPSAARHFLTGCSDEQKSLLDNGTDLRNRALRDLVTAATAHTEHIELLTNGSVPETHRSSCGGAIQGVRVTTKDDKTYVAEPVVESKMPEVPLDLLYDIKLLTDKYGEDTVTQGLGIFQYLKS